MDTLIIAFLFVTNTAQFNLPPNLLSSLCYVESKHNPNAIHKDDGKTDSLGICQVKLATAKSLGYKGTAKGLLNPNANIYYAAKYLSYQRSRYHGSISKAIIAYNRGNAKGLILSEYSVKVTKQWNEVNKYEKQKEIKVCEENWAQKRSTQSRFVSYTYDF